MTHEYRKEEAKQYYALRYRFKRSTNYVQYATEYMTREEAESQAAKNSEYDLVHYYEVVYIKDNNAYLGDCFLGCQTETILVSNWHEGVNVGF